MLEKNMNESVEMMHTPEAPIKWKIILRQSIEEAKEGMAKEMTRTTNNWAAAFRTRLATFLLTLEYFKGDEAVPQEEWKTIRDSFDAFTQKVKELHEAHAAKGEDIPVASRDELFREFESLIT